MAEMTQDKAARAQRKFRMQTIAFCLIVLPPIGIYFSVTLGMAWVTWVLMAMILGGMLLTIRYA